jgi:methionine-S-sulfoxide reductase
MTATIARWFALLLVVGAGAERLAAETLTPEPLRRAAEQPSAADTQQSTKLEKAVFAGGCFWCTELAFEQLKGVTDVETGYCGGTSATAHYERVHEGRTRHAEAIRVTYDPKKIRYEQLLDVFFDAHDPTQLNRQGEDDVGRQYRSAIFFTNEQQRKEAESKIKQLDQAKVFKRRIATKLEPFEAFYPAEDIHQNFAINHPFLPYIQAHAIPKACTVRMMHPELIDLQR